MSKPKVLFICLGNSCRSIMAEALARHRCEDRWEAASAGLNPLIRAPAKNRCIERGEGIYGPLERTHGSITPINTATCLGALGERQAVQGPTSQR
jgi:predicted protein tyrosine phosphatase